MDLLLEVQRALRDLGYNLGSSGPGRDGVDGVPGDRTYAAMLAELRRQSGQAAPWSPIDAISVSLLKVACPERSEAELAPLVEPIRAACRRFEINTIRRVAAFISQMAHESGLRLRTENLNYSVGGLLSGFGRHRISEANARQLGRKVDEDALPESRQKQIANLIYGGAWGAEQLGNTQPGDGWKMRGRGLIQLTGRRNWEGFAASMGMGLDDALAYAETAEGGVMAAAWFWEHNDINRLADTPGVSDETRRINGGSIGLADREARFNRTVAALLRAEAEAKR